MASTPVTFTNDIGPLFSKWAAQMMWRLDLTSYDDVKMNAEIIFSQIESGNMPPPNIATLTPAEINLFRQWMQDGYLK